MTDRGATELKVNKLLNELEKRHYRVINKWEEISDEDVKQFEDNEFKCAVHPLLQYSAEADKVVQQYEKEHHISININGINMNKVSVCQIMIRSMDKLFYIDNCSDPQLFKARMFY